VVRRSENADLAAGYGRVLVLSPFGARPRMPLEWGMDLATQVDELRAGGRGAHRLTDAGAGDVFDVNALDPSRRPPAARGASTGPSLRGAARGNLALTPVTQVDSVPMTAQAATDMRDVRHPALARMAEPDISGK
jgi:hypothetical protein